MADEGQGEIGEPHGVKVIIASQEEDDDPEVTLGDGGSPVMTMQKKVMLHQTVKIVMGTLLSQTPS